MAKLVTINAPDSDGQFVYELASFWDPLAARVIDAIIIFIPSAFVPIIAPWLYWSLQQSGQSQATVGQKALNIKVVDVYGRKVNFGQATGRFFGNFLNILTFFIGYLLIFTNDNNQCLHDMVSNCMVVRDKVIQSKDDIIEHLV